MWDKENELFISMKVDREGILGKIAKANALQEELRETLRELERMVSIEESQPKKG